MQNYNNQFFVVVNQFFIPTLIMNDLIKIKGLKGKQNKKKWNKNIDVSALLEKMSEQHTEKVRE
jgi:hypothetical protein